MSIPKDLLGLYAGLSQKEIFYLKARWIVSPISAVEELVPKEGRVYDIGCGAGLLSNTMAMRSGSRDVTGIDLSEEKIALAKRTILARKNIRFEKADALNLILDSPDVVVACDLIHHIPFSAQEIFLEHIYSMLSQGGLLLIQDIDKRPFLKYLFAYWADMLQGNAGNLYYRSSGELGNILERAGFKVEIRRLDKRYPIAAVLLRCVKK